MAIVERRGRRRLMVRYEPNGIGVIWSDNRGFVPTRLYTYDDLFVPEGDDELALKAFAKVVNGWRESGYVLLAAWLVKTDDKDKSVLSFTSYDNDIRSLEFGGDKAEFDRIRETYKKGEA